MRRISGRVMSQFPRLGSISISDSAYSVATSASRGCAVKTPAIAFEYAVSSCRRRVVSWVAS
jgi:hypothetical protein